MLINAAGTQAVCSLGSVHKGSLWMYKIGAGAPEVLQLTGAKYLSIKAGRNDFFSVVHHWDGDRLEISAHNHTAPALQISSIFFRCSRDPRARIESKLVGDSSVWRELPSFYVAYAFGDFHLFVVNGDRGISCQKFSWYKDTDYDKGYQGIICVEDLPNGRALIVSVQRDSNPILYDHENDILIRKLNLAGRRGNPKFKLRASSRELWASDYDTIVKLDAQTLNVAATRRIQDAPRGTQQFMGEFSFYRSDSLCLVARPFSGDVIGLDCDTLNQTHRVALGRQPLIAGLLGDDKIVALDWKTGDFLEGTLRRG